MKTNHTKTKKIASTLGRKFCPPLALAVSIALCAPAALAKPGNGKGGGGGGNDGGGDGGGGDPPADAPINYALTWLTEEETVDDTRLWDVDSGGVAVGQFRPSGSADDRFGIISFPGRPVTDLEAIVRVGAHAGDQLPADWDLTAVFTISEGLTVGGDLVDAAGVTQSFAAQLSDDGTTTSADWFRIFPAPPNVAWVYLMDASENGDYLALDVKTTGSGGETAEEIARWAPGDPTASPEYVVAETRNVTEISINNSGQLCWSVAENYNRDTYIDDPNLGIIVVDDDPRFYGVGHDIAEDATVFGSFLAKRNGTLKPGLWSEGAGWSRLSEVPTGDQFLGANSAGQALGLAGSDDRPFLFSAADGYLKLDDLVVGSQEDLDRWSMPGSFVLWSTAHPLSEPDATGYGHIAGYVTRYGDYEGRAFILTPVPVAP